MNVKKLIDLKCCISFTDVSKQNTLNSNDGQTILYWIIKNTPGSVCTVFHVKIIPIKRYNF